MLMNGVLCVGTLSFNSKKEKLSELTEKKVFFNFSFLKMVKVSWFRPYLRHCTLTKWPHMVLKHNSGGITFPSEHIRFYESEFSSRQGASLRVWIWKRTNIGL